MEKHTSSTLKAVGLAYLRYARRLPLVCTEVGRWNADIMGVSPESAIEIEVKVSKADLKNEFKSKSAKHYVYAHAKEETRHCPNTFYFLVPSEMADFAKELVEAEGSKAGVLSYNGTPLNVPFDQSCVSVAKRPGKLRVGPPSADLIELVTYRCGSELAGLYLWNDQFGKQFLELAKSGRDAVVRLTAESQGLLDVEDSDALEARAKEMVACYAGRIDAWFMADKSEQERWRIAAQNLSLAKFRNVKCL